MRKSSLRGHTITVKLIDHVLPWRIHFGENNTQPTHDQRGGCGTYLGCPTGPSSLVLWCHQSPGTQLHQQQLQNQITLGKWHELETDPGVNPFINRKGLQCSPALPLGEPLWAAQAPFLATWNRTRFPDPDLDLTLNIHWHCSQRKS